MTGKEGKRHAPEQGFADLLISGPRGRRLLLEYALRSEQLHDSAPNLDSFALGFFRASQKYDVAKGTLVVLFGPGAAAVEIGGRFRQRRCRHRPDQ